MRHQFFATLAGLSVILMTACKSLPVPQPVTRGTPQSAASCPAPPWMNPSTDYNKLGALRSQLISDQQKLGKSLDLVVQTFNSQISPQIGSPTKSVSVAQLKSLANTLFANNIRDLLAKPVAPSTEDSLQEDESLFGDAVRYYLKALFQGKYVDRFGNKLNAPTIVSTISDTDIASVVDVLLDAVGDYLWRSPVWVDDIEKPTKFYPAALVDGASAVDDGQPPIATTAPTPSVVLADGGLGVNVATRAGGDSNGGATESEPHGPETATGALTPTLEPTALAFNRDPKVQKDHPEVINDASGTVTWADLRWTPIAMLEKPGADRGCGLDESKLEVVEYVSQLTGQEASTVTGLSLGSFGGWGFSLGPYLKFSVGDNQTLQTVARALLSKTAERLVAEAAYRAAFYIDETKTDASKMAAQMPTLPPLK